MGCGVDIGRAEEREAAGEWCEAAVEYRKLLAAPKDDTEKARLSVRLAACLIETCGKGEVDEASDCLADEPEGY